MPDFWQFPTVSMGLGQAMLEQVIFDQGLIMNAGLLEYKTPGILDSPEIESIIVESADAEGPREVHRAVPGVRQRRATTEDGCLGARLETLFPTGSYSGSASRVGSCSQKLLTTPPT